MLTPPTTYLSPRETVPYLPRVSVWDFLFRRSPNEENFAPPNQDAYVDATSGRVIRATFQSMCKSLAYAFKERLGLAKGDNVLVFSANSLYFPSVVLAVQVAGLVCSPANAHFKPHELAYQIRDSGAKVVVAGCDQASIASEACSGTGVQKIFVMEKRTDAAAVGSYCSIWDFVDENELEPEPISEDDAATSIVLLCYSSGTSGRPKGVMTTHYNITSALLQTMLASPRSFTSKEIWIAALPLSHMYAAFYHVYLATYIGAKVIIIRNFSPIAFLETIERYKVTAGHIVPPIAVKITKNTHSQEYNLSSVREWRCAAAPAGKELIEALEQRWGIKFHAQYAMTETTGVMAMTRAGDCEKAPLGAAGRLMASVEAKIHNGELCVKGPHITAGYLNRHDANAEAFDDEGFMRTGDLVHVDDDGYIFVLDRMKEIIKFNGYQVPPAELEDILLKHPEVQDAAVVGIFDAARATEIPVACVVLRLGLASFDASALAAMSSDIVNFVASQVAHFKQLRGGVRFLTNIPRSSSGKVLRRLLRERFIDTQKPDS